MLDFISEMGMLQITISLITVFIVSLLFNLLLKTYKKEDGSRHIKKTAVMSLVWAVLFSVAFLLVNFLFFSN